MNSDLDKIREIGTKVRNICLDKYKNRFDSSLSACCAIASGRLFKELSKVGYKPIIIENQYPDDDDYGHCYVMVEDYVIDVTATQFGQSEPICLFKYGEHDEKDQESYWYWYNENNRKTYNSVHELRQEQFRQNWPAEQIYWSNKYCNG
jgi:hypothetical protein